MEEHSSLINEVQTQATPRKNYTRGLLLAIAAVLLLVVSLSSFTTNEHSFSADAIPEQEEDVVEITQTNLFYKYTLGEEYVCADGSPYVFYIRRPNATSPNYNKWVVTQEGTGRQCEDQDSCDEKYLEFDGYYMSSNGMPGCLTREPEGGLNSVQEEYNARFHDYSLVWSHSGNGDDSLGQARAGENGNPTTWHWTGSINMWATFEHLIQNFIKQ